MVLLQFQTLISLRGVQFYVGPRGQVQFYDGQHGLCRSLVDDTLHPQRSPSPLRGLSPSHRGLPLTIFLEIMSHFCFLMSDKSGNDAQSSCQLDGTQSRGNNVGLANTLSASVIDDVGKPGKLNSGLPINDHTPTT